MSEPVQDVPDVSSNDIVFDCPHCGKSLAIDPRGAGLIIHCPDCSEPVQVPGLPVGEREGIHPVETEGAMAGAQEPEEEGEACVEGAGNQRVEEMEAALEASHAKIARLVESLEEVRERRRYLEKLRTDNIARFRQIGKELETIQHAMDRIVAHLQDAAVENGAEE